MKFNIKNSLIDILYEAKRQGILLHVEEGRIKIKVKKGIEVPKNFIAYIKENKEAIIELLTSSQINAEIGEVIAKNNTEEIPLSFAQQSIWFIDTLGEGSTQYHLPAVIRIKGSINKNYLAESFKKIIERHQVLRTIIKENDDTAVANVITVDNFKMTVEAINGKNEREIINEEIAKPFNLSKDYMIRVRLVELSPENFILIVVMHHIASDGWSIPILINELEKNYQSLINDAPLTLPELSIQYGDYALWQRKNVSNDQWSSQMEYWESQLKGYENLELPYDYVRPSIQGFKGEEKVFHIKAERFEKLKQVANEHQTTLYVTLLSIFKILLSRLSGQDDICIATPVANRKQAQVADLIGFFANTIVLRSTTNAFLQFSEYVKKVKETVISGFDNQEAPFEKVVDMLVKNRSLDRNPLAQVLFSYANQSEYGTVKLGDTHVEIEEILQKTSKFDLSMDVIEQEDDIKISIIYNPELFTASTIERITEYYVRILDQVVSDSAILVKDIALLATSDKKALLSTSEEFSLEEASLELYLEAIFNRYKDKEALRDVDGQGMSYAALWSQSTKVSTYLSSHYELKQGDTVVLYSDRSIDMVVLFLALARLGCMYVPVDKIHPEERLAYIAKDSNSRLLIVEGDTAINIENTQVVRLSEVFEASSEVEEVQTTKETISLDATLYIIYTSGSTGKPKGVCVSHGNLLGYLKGIEDEFGEHRVQPVLSSHGFDIFFFELLSPLLKGGTSILLRNEEVRDMETLESALQKSTSFHAVPALMRAVLDHIAQTNTKEAYAKMTELYVGGDVVPNALLHQMQSLFPQAKIYVFYGPTEGTIFVTSKLYEPGSEIAERLALGTSLRSSQVLVLDRWGDLVAPGVKGELCIGGVQVSKGYLHNEVLTNEKYTDNPYGKGKLYRTGDLARWDANGNIEYLGREDSQIKLRGYRIELGEITRVVENYDGISQAVVVKTTIGDGEHLVCYYIESEDIELDTQALQSYLGEQLPSYMVPSHYQALLEFPLTSNGKLDKKQLPAIHITHQAGEQEAQTKDEKAMVAIWEGLLGIRPIGIETSFFELGGDSIKAIQLMSRSKQQGYHFKVKDVFKHPTVKGLLSVCGASETVLVETGLLEGDFELLPIQHRFIEANHPAAHHYNQSVLLSIPKDLSSETLQSSLSKLIDHHDILRSSYKDGQGFYQPEMDNYYKEEIVSDEKALTALCQTYQESFDLSAGPLIYFVKIAYAQDTKKDRLFIVAHHLVIDGVSWRIVLEDLEQLLSNQNYKLPAKQSSLRQWSNGLSAYAASLSESQQHYWQEISREYTIIKDLTKNPLSGRLETHSNNLKGELTKSLSQEIHGIYGTELQDVLLGCLSKVLGNQYDTSKVYIDIEGHGREEIIAGLDISRTVGWFTSLYPLKLEVSETIGVYLRDTKDMLREVPDGGLGYGALRYLSATPEAYTYSKGGILFNYLGDFDGTVSEEGLVSFAGESTGDNIHPSNSEGYGLLLTFMIVGGELQMNWSYDKGMYSALEISELSTLYKSELEAIIAHCKASKERVLSCSDCGLSSSVGNATLDSFIKDCEQQYGTIASIYRLSPLQEGMLFHSLYGGEGSGSYVSEFVCDFNGGINYEVFVKVWDSIVARHGILRTGIYSEGLGDAVQCVYKKVDLPITRYDYTDKEATWLSNYFENKKLVSFDMQQAPLFSFELYDLPGGITRLYLYNHHILWDGWSLSILMNEFIQGYDAALEGEEIAKGYVSDYGRYVRDLYTRDRSGEGIDYWQDYLKGIEGGVYLPFLQDTSLRNSVFGDSHVSFELDHSHTRLLVDYSKSKGLTMNTLVQGAWSYLLHSYTGAEKIVFGATVSGRDWSVGSVEQEVGLYINTLPVSIEIARDSDLGDWLSDLQAGHSKGREQYSHVSLSMIQEAMGVSEALFDSLIVFDNYPMESVIAEAKSKLQVSNIVPKLYNNYALTIGVSHTGNKLHFKLDYNKKVFPQEYVEMIVEHLKRVFERISEGVEKVGNLDYINTKEEFLPSIGNRVALDNSTTIISLFEKQVAQTPNAIALEYRNKELTYQEVNHQANQLATYLIRNFNISSGDVVSVLLPRSSNSVIAIMGILKAGAAYLPIDTEYPDTRIHYMLENSASKCVITYAELAAKIKDTKILEWDSLDLTRNEKEEKITLNGDSLAYIIYTSGSTGQPKGVMISHKSITNYICWAEDYYLEEKQTYNFPLYSSLSFDLTLTSIFLPLIGGHKIIIYPESKTVLTDWVLTDNRINIIKLTPSHLRMIKDYQPEGTQKVLEGLQKVIVGGEKLESNLAFEISKLFHHNIDIFNEYGPTEATVGCSIYKYDHEKDKDAVEISIGSAIANTRLYVLDNDLRKVAPGVWGELCVSGVGLSRGYIGKEALTAEKFIANPYEEGEKMYRTGDICRWNTKGELEFKGRKDTQVKLRGYRIELGEIESVVSLQEGISQSVVVLHCEGEVQDLACYVVLDKDTSLDTEALKASLTEALPEYMVPTHYMVLEELPLTINGKVDKKRLPAIETGSLEGDSDFTKIELSVRSIWSDILEIDEERIFKGDSFFNLGGNSLIAISLINRLSKHLEVKVPLDEVFSSPTLEAMSAYISGMVKSCHTSIPSLGNQEYYALSSAQRRMYFLYEFNRESITYNMPNVVILRGMLDTERFENTIKGLISRHESLRTYFEMQGDEVYQKILPEESVRFSVDHYQGDALESEKTREIIENYIRPFDLSQGPLLRVGLIQINSEEHILMLDMHHIITDGVSQGILVRDFMELYKDDSSLKELGLRYVDYSDWQQKEGIEAKSKDYWMEIYKDIPEVLDIPTDYPRGSVRDEGGSSVVFELAKDQVEGLKKLSEEYGITLYMLLLGIYKILLSKLSGQEDVVVGTPVAGRGHSDVEGIVGLFVNTLALRSDVKSAKSFKSYIKDLGERVISSFDHQDFQYEELVNLLEIERDTSRNALFDVMFSYESMGDRSVQIPGLVLEPYDRSTTISKFDLDLSAFEDGEGNLQMSFEYATSLYNRATIERYRDYYVQILTAILNNPSQKIAEIDMLSMAERNMLLNEFNKTEKEYDIDVSIIALVEKQAAQTPEQIAVVDNEQEISYHQLLNDVYKVAGYLSENYHIKHNSRVAIQMNRGSNAITTLLAILKLGATYIPIDPTLPQARINYILESSNSDLLIIENKDIEQEPLENVKTIYFSAIHHENLVTLNTPKGTQNLAYIIYTSGSTGEPKGVMIENRSLVNLCRHMIDFYEISEKDKILQFAPLHFDMSVEEIFPALVGGATLYIRNDEILASSSNFIDACKKWNLTILNLPTAFWNYLYAGMETDGSKLPESVKILAVGGEALHLETTKKWVHTFGTTPQLVNAYGPTEVTVNTCMIKLNEEVLSKNQLHQVPIGAAISNHKIFILDKNQQLTPMGSVGEICVSGPGVAKGYVGMETLTHQKFIQNPFGEGLLYRTGDMGKWGDDGSIEFIGRKDNQVKIRGHRIETGDIESHIVMMDAIEECVVTVKEFGGDKTLVAYYTSRTSVDDNKIQEFLAQKLPEYMVPAYFCEIAKIPWKTNGKVDKKQLPEIAFKNKENYVAPSNTLEKEITQIWSEILDIEKDQISINSDFFRIGGHSLKAMSFINKVENTFDVKISLRDFFTKPTIKQVAIAIELTQWLKNDNKEETTTKKIIKI